MKTMNLASSEMACSFLDKWLSYYFRNSNLPAISVTIFYKNKSIYSRAFGMADVEEQVPLTTDHLFNIGSQAKMFTAVAVAQLAEKGIVGFDDPIGTYLPWLKKHDDPQFAKIQINQLLQHKAGILRDGPRSDYWQLALPFPNKQELKNLIFDSKIVIKGDPKLKYSNLGYALLGQVIQSATKSKFTEYILNNIIKPLDLQQTTFDLNRAEKFAAKSYSRRINNKRLAAPKQIATNTFDSVVGVYSTTSDMCRFIAGLNQGKLLSHVSRDKLWHNDSPQDKSPKYSHGFSQLNIGRELVGHSGGFFGYQSCTYLDQSQDVIVSVVGTSKDTPIIELARGIFGALEFFINNSQTKNPPVIDKLNELMVNYWGAMHFVATSKKIVVVYPEQAEPFRFVATELKRNGNDNDFTILAVNDRSFDAEECKFIFANDKLESVVYGGSTFWPEDVFITKLV